MKANRIPSRVVVLSALVAVAQICAAIVPGATRAEEASGTPVYVGLGPAFGFEDFDDAGGIDIDEAYGLNAWAGYRFVDFLSAEMNLEYLDGFDFSTFGGDVEGDTVSLTLNAKVFPLSRLITDRIDPFLYTGIGLGWAEYEADFGGPANRKEAEFIARFGLGVDLYLLESVAFQASSSYVLPTGELDDLSYVSLVFGLQYRFGVPWRN